MMAFVFGYCQRSYCLKYPLSFSHKFIAARRNLALFQHHDGVTGTAKNHVVEDYGNRMHISLQDLLVFMSKSIEVLMGPNHNKTDPALSLVSQFEPLQLRSKYDVQPVYRAIKVPEGSLIPVVVFNPTEQIRNEIMMVIVEKPDVSVLHSNWSCVMSQISPELHYESEKIFTGKHRLYWELSVAPFGLSTYYIANGFVGCEKATPAKLRVSSNAIQVPVPYVASKLEGDTADIKNANQVLTFDLKLGLLQKIAHKNGMETNVREEIGIYSSSGSGAYLFKPVGEAEPIVNDAGTLVISEGLLVQEFYSRPTTKWNKSPVSHSSRVYNGADTIHQYAAEMEYHVEMLDYGFNDKELIVRYKTDIDNGKILYSDLNGFQMSRRETYDKIPLQGNYYPMPSTAFIQDLSGHRFTVHTRQSLGVASLKNGWMEIMLDRRLVNDDGRGLGQGVMDNRPMNVVFHLLVESNISVSIPPTSYLPHNPSLLSHLVGSHLNYPMHAFLSKTAEEISVQAPPKEFSPLAAPLPCDLHILSFKVPQPLKYSVHSGEARFAIILQRRKWEPSHDPNNDLKCSTLVDEGFNLFSMFKDLEVLNGRPTSLNLLHDDVEALGYLEQVGEVEQEGQVTISPMELQAYKLELRSRQV